MVKNATVTVEVQVCRVVIEWTKRKGCAGRAWYRINGGKLRKVEKNFGAVPA